MTNFIRAGIANTHPSNNARGVRANAVTEFASFISVIGVLDNVRAADQISAPTGLNNMNATVQATIFWHHSQPILVDAKEPAIGPIPAKIRRIPPRKANWNIKISEIISTKIIRRNDINPKVSAPPGPLLAAKYPTIFASPSGLTGPAIQPAKASVPARPRTHTDTQPEDINTNVPRPRPISRSGSPR
ncbi:MAG: hypothetical protein Q618_VCMC00003G0160 [Varibaculum cambriense DORA_20]|nr:MAG: hypothetical protein Q618_VCMC00003G0160 [Varibaculum cambriense DORA_20]